MDPFSAAASAIGVADVCFRVGKYIQKYVKELAGIDELVEHLQTDIEALANVCKAIHEVYEHASGGDADSPFLGHVAGRHGQSLSVSSTDMVMRAPGSPGRSPLIQGGMPPSLANLNDLIRTDLSSCQRLVEEMEALFETVVKGDENDDPGSIPEGEGEGEGEQGHAAIAKIAPKERRAVSRKLQRAKEAYGKLSDKKARHSAYTSIEHQIRRKQNQIGAYKQEMMIMLQIINYFYATSVDERTAVSFEKIASSINDLGDQIARQIQDAHYRDRLQPEEERDQKRWEQQYVVSLQAISKSIDLGLAAIRQESINMFFDIPQAVSPNYTGRKSLLLNLKKELLPSGSHTPDSGQRVFVIHGLGGSGKTQFCCKFAQDNRFQFWGVFWVDASTERKLKRTLVDIFIRYGGGSRGDADVNQARAWLSGLGQPWLLIIDNADHPNLNIAQYLPTSPKGCVLITTKSKNHISLGTVGERYCSFSGLEKDEATELLLVSSFTKREKWSDVKAIAEQIAKELGYLALALVHAGAAIHKELCTFAKYIDYFKITCKQITEQHRTIHGQGESHRTSNLYRSSDLYMDDLDGDDGDADGDLDTERDMPVFATWEICYQRLSKQAAKNVQASSDAVQLLEIFAFLDSRRFSKEILVRAVRNAALEQEEAARNRAKAVGKGAGTRAESQGYLVYWLKRFGTSMAAAFVEHVSQGGAKTVPALVAECRRDSKDINTVEWRIRTALNELSQMSLIGSNQEEDTYFMHPVVHTWARERLSIAHQALLAEMTSNVLSASILLPPLGSENKDDVYHVSILAHIEYVTQAKAIINKRILSEREKRQRRASAVFDYVYNLVAIPDSEAILLQAKFGFIYAKSGMLAKARDRFLVVQEQLYRYKGKESEEARKVDQVLSDIYFALGDGPKARALLEDVLARCEATLGKKHEDTYRAMGKLGRTLWMMGFINEAYREQTAAVKGLEETLGKDAWDTLEVVDQLGSTVSKFWKPEDLIRAYGLHKRVVDTLSQRSDHGEDHERVLFATENMCRVAVQIKRRGTLSVSSDGSGDDEPTPPSPEDPFATAPIGPGSFNPEDLDAEGGGIAAMSDAARVVPEPAERVVPMMARVLRVRQKTLGERHPFTLLAMVNYAITKSAVGEFAEAEQILRHGLTIAYGVLPKKHIGILFGRQTLACVLREQGKHLEAGNILRQVYQYQAEMDVSEGFHPDRLATLIELSHCYLLAGDVDASIQEITTALDGFTSITDEKHPIMIQTRQTHAQLLQVKKCRAEGVPEPKVQFPRYLYES